ncbi:hypothetical protein J3B02_002231, partial [Coemansia erecta]
ADSQPSTPPHQRGAAQNTADTAACSGSPSHRTPTKSSISISIGASSARRFDRTPTTVRRGRLATIATDTHIEPQQKTPVAHRSGSTRTRTATSALSFTVGGSRPFSLYTAAASAATAAPTTPTKRSSKKAAAATTALSLAALSSAPRRSPPAEFTFRSSPTPTSPEFAGLFDRAQPPPQLVFDRPPQHLEFVGAALLPSLSRRATTSEHKLKHTSLRIGSAARRTQHQLAMATDNDNTHGADDIATEPLRAGLAPVSPCAYEIPNDNENDGQYAAEFWLNALVPKPHTNFFGYEASIGPICISISTRESHECYKALVRTPFKFGVVYVPTVVINQPVFGTDLDRLSNPTSPKILLYHALRLYFQQADIERRGYLLTAIRNRRLAAETNNEAQNKADIFVPSLQRSSARRSNELRRAEISEFMDTLFNTPDAAANTPSGSSSSTADDAALVDEINAYLAAEREQRDLAVATESLTEIRDDHLKPLLRNLEPRLFRRWLRLDFVVVGAAGHDRLADANAPHQRFLRALERANSRARGDSGAASKAGAKADAKAAGARTESNKAARRLKTREELEAKRSNIIEELIATERSYVEKLRALIDIYVVPLRSAARSANNALIPAYDAHVIFGNIERVTEVNERFLGDLEAWAAGEMDPRETIGSLCRDHFVDFQVYKRYINGYQHALASSRELEAKNPLYAAFLQRAREREECRKLGISDLLIMPVQRIPRYTLLLTDLLKATLPDDDDAARIQLALERVNEIGQLADNQVAESVAELHRIHTTIDDCPPNLISASREFIGAIDVSEIDLVTGSPKRPVALLVFSDLLMVVERFWPPHDHGGIRITGQPPARQSCPVHAGTAAAVDPSSGADHKSSACTCNGSGSVSSTAFLSTISDSSRGKRWGRFSGWVDIGRVGVLEKSLNSSSRSFYIHRHPSGAPGADDAQASATAARLRTATTTTTATATSTATATLAAGQQSSASSIVSLESGAANSPMLAPDQLHQEFSRILYPAETAHESYGEHGYWFPQSLHEFEADHPQTRDAFFEFLNTAWERSVARCFESTASLSRQGSSSGGSGPGTSAATPGASSSRGHRKTKSGVEGLRSASSHGHGHPELDRVDVGGQSWSVRMWEATDYAKSRTNCPSALAADMTIVWDYRQAGSPAAPPALPSYCPLQACRVVDFGDDYYHVTSTVLPLDSHHSASEQPDTCAELLEERDVADSWPALCRLVEKAVTMYQYVLLAYPEHRRIQQCYNRSILASLFGQNALGSSSSVKADTAVSAAPRKLFSRARHLFSSGKLRGSASASASVKGGAGADHNGLFASAYSNAVAADSIGPSASSPYSHSTISTPLTVLGRYKLKTKSSTMVSSRRVHTLQHDPQSTPPPKAQSASSTPSRSNAAGQPAKPSLSSSATFSAGDASMFSLATTSSSTSTRLSPASDAFPAGRKPSHTIDDFPSFSSSMLTDDSVDIRTRSQTSWEQRTRAASSISSIAHSSPPKQPFSRFLRSRPSKDALSLLPASLTGSSPSLVKLGELAASRPAKIDDPDPFTKRRSMSVVSAASAGLAPPATQSIDSVASAASTTAPSSRVHGDGGSDFSLSLDILQPRGERLSIPDDLKLEFDTALNRAGNTPPPPPPPPPQPSTRGLALDIEPFAPSSSSLSLEPSAMPVVASSGLSLLIPSSTNLPSAASTWDMVSPDYDVPAEYQSRYPLGSASSVGGSVFSSSRSMMMARPATPSSKSMDRRRGVYGAPPHSAAPAPLSPGLIRPQVLSSEADILLDIARELGEDEPFNNNNNSNNKPSPDNISSLYIDADDVARHLSNASLAHSRPQTSAAITTHSALSSPTSPSSNPVSPTYSEFSRPLPSTPSHSKSLNYGSDKHSPMQPSAAPHLFGRIPHPPSSTYSLHQQHPVQQGQQQQSQSPSSFADYRRLPSLPPRIRSAAASSYLDRNLAQSGPTSPAGRSQPAFPPF